MIYLGADHAGFKLKEQIKNYLKAQKLKFQDLGNFKLDKKDDYPEFGFKVAKAVAKNPQNRGILICGTSYGICIVANKVKGIRAVTVNTVKDAKNSREHNDSNIICLAGWYTNFNLVKKIIKVWLATSFPSATRHQRRVRQIKKIESKEFK
jgi:ribose 5-phosphate isomerase B